MQPTIIRLHVVDGDFERFEYIVAVQSHNESEEDFLKQALKSDGWVYDKTFNYWEGRNYEQLKHIECAPVSKFFYQEWGDLEYQDVMHVVNNQIKN